MFLRRRLRNAAIHGSLTAASATLVVGGILEFIGGVKCPEHEAAECMKKWNTEPFDGSDNKIKTLWGITATFAAAGFIVGALGGFSLPIPAAHGPLFPHVLPHALPDEDIEVGQFNRMRANAG